MRNCHHLFSRVLIFILLFFFALYRWADAAESATSVEEIVKKNSPAIVLIGALNPKGTSFGSGFIVSSDGLIITNLHVVKNAMKIEVKFMNKKAHIDAGLVSSDAKKDIAILQIARTGLTAVVLGDSDRAQIGEKVVAIGNPLGLENTVSDGLISSVRDAGRNMKVLQITAPVSPGSSGCPLFNMKGEVVGIAVGSNQQGQNINFAIPINYAKKILPQDRSSRPAAVNKNQSKPAASVVYVVRSGDTLFDLARKFDTTVDDLMKLNYLSDTKIFVGQILRMPKVW